MSAGGNDGAAARAAAMAGRLLAAYRSGETIDARPDDGPVDETEAYLIQARIATSLGPVGAFKTGRKAPADRPIMAPIRGATVLKSGASIDNGESRLRGVELEIGFLLKDDPPAPKDPRFEQLLRERIVVLPALEIVESRLTDPEAGGSLWKLADNQLNGGLVVGEEVQDWALLDRETVRARLTFDGQAVWNGPARVPGGDAFATFVRFARQVNGHCGGLRAGMTVTTGSVTGLLYAASGIHVEGEIEGFGSVATRFA